MVVIILERVPASLRGELTRWMLELRAGVFVGTVSAMVRDKLWDYVCSRMNEGAGLLVHSTDTEQGFAIRFWGETDRQVEDFEGLTLIRMPP
ncbi:MAG: type I-E CRISPR-associated endoribonuclease Cas2 [Chloroflexi bacterium]|nr:type I-E CRISPR-associated endoribonuclease Cas2 [Chloroflexota bacterium]